MSNAPTKCYDNVYTPATVVYSMTTGLPYVTFAYLFPIASQFIQVPPDLLQQYTRKIDVSKQFVSVPGIIGIEAVGRIYILTLRSQLPGASFAYDNVPIVYPPLCEQSFVLMRHAKHKFTPIAVSGNNTILSNYVGNVIASSTPARIERQFRFSYTVVRTAVTFFSSSSQVDDYIRYLVTIYGRR